MVSDFWTICRRSCGPRVNKRNGIGISDKITEVVTITHYVICIKKYLGSGIFGTLL